MFRLRYVFPALLLVSLLGACVPARLGISWAGIRIIGENQNILMAYNDRLILVEPATGNLVEIKRADGSIATDSEGRRLTWQLTGDQGAESQFFSVPVLQDENTLIAASLEGKIFKLGLEGLAIQRSPKVFNGTLTPGSGCNGECVLADLVLEGNTLFVPLNHKDIVALNADDLSELWRATTEQGIWAKPLVFEGSVYFGAMDHSLYALNARTGQIRWSLNLKGAIASSPVEHNGRLYVGTLGRKLFALSLDGQILDEFAAEDWVWSSPVIVEDMLYLADLSGYVYAIDISNGFKPVWKAKAADKGIRPSPLVVDDMIIVASRDGFVHWLDRATGAPRFAPTEVGAEILSDIILVEATETSRVREPLIIVSTVAGDKLLVALKLESGQKSWVFPRS